MNVGARHFNDVKSLLFRARFLIEEDKCADKDGNQEHDAEDFEDLFHCD